MTRIFIVPLALLLSSAACTLDKAFPIKLLSVDETLFVLMHSSGQFGEVTVEPSVLGREKLLVSKDHGRSWESITIRGLSDFGFVDSQRGHLVINDVLYQTRDGGYTRQKMNVPRFYRLKGQSDGPAVASFSKDAVHVSGDLGETWRQLRPLPPRVDQFYPVFIEMAGDLLAIATSQGRVYTADIKSDAWSEWIVGPVQDLRYHEGRFYALTGMATVAVLDGKSVEHIKLENDFSSFRAFSRYGHDLYFSSHRGIYRLSDRQALQEFRFPDEQPEGMPQLFSLISPAEAIAISTNGKGSTVYSIRFDRHEERQVSVLP